MKIIILFLLFLPAVSFPQGSSKLSRLEKINWTDKGLNLEINSLPKKLVIPSLLMVTGLSLNTVATKTNLQDFVRAPFNGFKTKADDYIMFGPAAILGTADLLKIPARNTIWHQTKYLFLSQVITGGIVQIMKFTLKIKRPDSSSNTSFPSGHTAFAAVNAQVLHNEFYRTRPLLGLSGHILSTSTGLFRVVNNKHWVPDVLMGAGIAILVTNLIYHFEPLKNWNPFEKKDQKVSMYMNPTMHNDIYGMQMRLTF